METNNHNLNQMLRTPDAAAYCGISKSTLDKYRITGQGPAYIKLGRAVVYDISDLNRWLVERKVRSTSE